MNLSKQGFDLIKSFEGFSSQVYTCPAGYKTIGYGHLFKRNELGKEKIEHDEAIEILENDIRIIENSLKRLTSVELTQNQFDALVSFTFNLGAGAYQRSSLRSKVNREDHDMVPSELIKWVYAAGRVSPGLLRRRTAEAEMYIS